MFNQANRNFKAPIAFILFLIMGAMNGQTALAQDGFKSAALNTPSGVHRVEAGGYWFRNDAEGFYRAIIVSGGIEHVQHRLYVQWLALDTKTNEYVALATREIVETNLPQGLITSMNADFGDLETMVLSVITRTRDDIKHKFTIRVLADGSYTATPRK